MTNAVDQVVLIGIGNVPHWMDGGPPRLLRLAFTQEGGRVRARGPSDPIRALLGHYLLFVLVDGIPSKGLLVSIQG